MQHPLLSPEDPPPFIATGAAGRRPLLLLCDHASNAVPRSLASLGLPATELGRHIGWDIGALDIARRLADLLDAPLVASGFSRLVIDCNRWPGGEGSTPEVSDGTRVPGNAGLAPADVEARAAACFRPYHDEVERRIADFAAAGVKPALFVVHTFTPVMNGAQRPWHLGVLWREDPRLAVPLLRELRRLPDTFTGDNEPYSARDPYEYTLTAHADGHGLPHCSIEVRQDLVATRADAERWAERIAPALAAAVDEAVG